MRAARSGDRIAFQAPLVVSSGQEALEIFTRAGNNIPIASPIYLASSNPESPESEAHPSLLSLNQKFPYRQIIRGNGACYLNACLVGILNKCVNDQEKWLRFKSNIAQISDEANRLINEIEEQAKSDAGHGLDLNKLNEILQFPGNENLCTRLAKAILIPRHGQLIQAYNDKIKEYQARIYQAYTSCNHDLVEKYREFLNIYEDYKKKIDPENLDFASSYEEAMLVPFVDELTMGMGQEDQPLKIFTFSDDILEVGVYGDIFTEENDPNPIYLYCKDGRTHFNLWYSSSDPICQHFELQEKQNTITKKTKTATDTKKREKLIEEINQYKLNPNHENSQIIDEITGCNLDNFLERASIDNLEFIKSLFEPSSSQASIAKKQVREGTLTKDSLCKEASNELKPDSQTCYQLAIDQINNNDQPDELFPDLLTYISSTDNLRHLALHVAMMGKTQFIDPLINEWPECFKVKDNFMNFDNTPLLWAIANAKNKFASELLDKNIDLDINFKSNRFNNTALHLAVAKGYIDIDRDRQKVGVANSELVKKLIAKGANPNIKTQDGQEGFTALDIAVLRCSQEMVEAILESPFLDMETISKALETFENFPEIAKKNQLLKEICTPIKELNDSDISSENQAEIKLKLEKKLNELRQKITIKKELKKSIEKEDHSLTIYHDTTKNIIKFQTFSVYSDNAKFDYNKKLESDEQYIPENYTKETEQEKILAMLTKAKDATLKRFSNSNLDDNFFIAVMRVASQNRGIARIDNQIFNHDFTNALKEIDPRLLTSNYLNSTTPPKSLQQIAQFFSANFQILSKADNYLTAREGKDGQINPIGRRLFRVCTKENIQKFQQQLKKTKPSNSPSLLPLTSENLKIHESESLKRSAVEGDMRISGWVKQSQNASTQRTSRQ